jgi:hypothetical protein
MYFTLRHSVYLPAGATVTLVALALLAPRGAEAGCSRLVSSHTDSVLASAVIEQMTLDLGGRPRPKPVPPPPRRCSGAWCAGRGAGCTAGSGRRV